MIKKLEIKNVGRFKSLKTDGDEQYFKKNTFIYGKNTFGKSTLTAVLRSLKENNPNYIVGRKSIGSQKQTVKIIPETTTSIGEYRYTTDENKWSAEYKDIIIFDSYFVRESVYTHNQQIGQEQQKNIESFMLGAKGVEYNTKIMELVDLISENTRIQASISTDYSRSKHLLGGLTFEAFLGLTQVPDVDKKISKEEKELDKIKNSELISSKLKAVNALLKRYQNFDATNISAKLSVNSELVAKHYNEHVNHEETKQSYSTFLQSGSRLRTRTGIERCPFCTQKMADDSVKEFLNTLDLFYNENYRKLQQAVRDAENLFSKSGFSVEIEKIKTDLKQAGYSLENDFSDVNDSLGSCEKSISAKKEDLSSDFNNSPFIEISPRAIDHVTIIDAELIKFQNPIERKNELENALKELKANKERFDSWKEKSEKYIKAKLDNEGLSTKKGILWDEYLAYANGLSTTMLGDINTVLSACNSNFTIQTFSFKGNQRQDLFVLNMGGNRVANNGDDSEPTVKNCLSDSDKWVLALAFFLATVKNDSMIKVVVMDDPVSSFDSDRKKIIMNEIKRILHGSEKQLILLTHEKGFYHLLHSERKADASAVFLKIVLDSQRGSEIISCNPNDDPEFMNDYNCWISDMKNAVNSQDVSFVKNAHSSIRRVVEHVLKTKYPMEIKKEHITMGAMLEELEKSGGPYEINSPRISIEAILPNVTHHDHSGVGQYPVNELGIEDYKKDIKDAFAVIKSL